MPDALQAVTNSTCLIGLERIEQLDILPQVFSTVTIPTAVQAEVGISADWLTIRTDTAFKQKLHGRLEVGCADHLGALRWLNQDCKNWLDKIWYKPVTQASDALHPAMISEGKCTPR